MFFVVCCSYLQWFFMYKLISSIVMCPCISMFISPVADCPYLEWFFMYKLISSVVLWCSCISFVTVHIFFGLPFISSVVHGIKFLFLFFPKHVLSSPIFSVKLIFCLFFRYSCFLHTFSWRTNALRILFVANHCTDALLTLLSCRLTLWGNIQCFFCHKLLQKALCAIFSLSFNFY